MIPQSLRLAAKHLYCLKQEYSSEEWKISSWLTEEYDA